MRKLILYVAIALGLFALAPSAKANPIIAVREKIIAVPVNNTASAAAASGGGASAAAVGGGGPILGRRNVARARTRRTLFGATVSTARVRSRR